MTMSADQADNSLETEVKWDDLALDYNFAEINETVGDWFPSDSKSDKEYPTGSPKGNYLASDPQPNEPYNLNLKEAYQAIFYDLGYDSLVEKLAEEEESPFKDYFPDIKVETVSKYQLPSSVLGMADPSSRRVFIREDIYDWAQEKVEEHEISHILHDWDELRNRLETNTVDPSRFVPSAMR